MEIAPLRSHFSVQLAPSTTGGIECPSIIHVVGGRTEHVTTKHHHLFVGTVISHSVPIAGFRCRTGLQICPSTTFSIKNPSVINITKAIEITSICYDTTVVISGHSVVGTVARCSSSIKFFPFQSLKIKQPSIIEAMVSSTFILTVPSVKHGLTTDVVERHSMLVS